jgi:hypothetical protein
MQEHVDNINNNECQMQSIPKIQPDKDGSDWPALSLVTRIRLFFRRHLDRDTRRKVKRLLFLNNSWKNGDIKKRNLMESTKTFGESLNLSAGDAVRVRSKDEILATLDSEGKLKGCSFVGEMWKYCGTTQKVLKPLHRFVDERNYKIIISNGLVLLEGVTCSGTDFYGHCDRSCYFFWREEWLEKA